MYGRMFTRLISLVTLCSTNWINITNINHFKKVCAKCRARTCKTCNIVKKYLKYHVCSEGSIRVHMWLYIIIPFKNKKGWKSEGIASIQTFFNLCWCHKNFSFTAVTLLTFYSRDIFNLLQVEDAILFLQVAKVQVKKHEIFLQATKHTNSFFNI